MLVLAAGFAWLSFLHLWQAHGHVAPWLFPDEVQYTQLARSVAGVQQGPAAGSPHSIPTLYSVLIAPAWLVTDNAHSAYALARDLGAIIMAATIFPAYALARLFASVRASLLAAIGVVLVPALAYSSLIIEEPLAYPYFTAALYVVSGALLARSRSWVIAASILTVGAIFVRAELLVLPITVVGVVAVLFASRRVVTQRRIRGGLMAVGVGVLVLAAFALVLASASRSWRIAESHPLRVVEYAAWAVGALSIGVGVLPLIAGVVALAHPRIGERAAFAFLASTAIALVGYAGVKAAYLSTFEPALIEERNLIYLAPILFTATAIWLDRGAARSLTPVWAGLVVVLVVVTPYHLNLALYSDALGLSNLQYLHNHVGVSSTGVVAIVIGMTLVLALVVLLCGRSARRPILALSAAVLALAWGAAGELAASSASNAASRIVLASSPPEPDWVDRVVGHHPAVYLARDLNAVSTAYSAEFWNAAIGQVWRLTGAARPGPGIVAASLISSSGQLSPAIHARYVLADPGVNPVGRLISRQLFWRLYKINTPLRLANQTTGVYSDGWMGPRSSHAEFTTDPNERLRIRLARPRWAANAPPVTMTIHIGPLGIRAGKPALISVAVTKRITLGKRTRFLTLPVVGRPYLVSVVADRTFRPASVGRADPRALSAVIQYSVRPPDN